MQALKKTPTHKGCTATNASHTHLSPLGPATPPPSRCIHILQPATNQLLQLILKRDTVRTLLLSGLTQHLSAVMPCCLTAKAAHLTTSLIFPNAPTLFANLRILCAVRHLPRTLSTRVSATQTHPPTLGASLFELRLARPPCATRAPCQSPSEGCKTLSQHPQVDPVCC